MWGSFGVRHLVKPPWPDGGDFYAGNRSWGDSENGGWWQSGDNFHKPATNVGPITLHQDCWEERKRLRGPKTSRPRFAPLLSPSITLVTQKPFVPFKPYCSSVQRVPYLPPHPFCSVVGTAGHAINAWCDDEESRGEKSDSTKPYSYSSFPLSSMKHGYPQAAPRGGSGRTKMGFWLICN